MFKQVNKDNPVIAWWSGGVTSAVACWIAIEVYGVENVRIIFIDTCNEHDDTYRFKIDCERWYGKEIETATRIGTDYQKIQDVWYKFLSLNVAHGAICSSELKRAVRIRIQEEMKFSYQVFGFDIDETKRAKNMTLNYPEANPVYLLLMFGYSKKKCINILGDNGIEIPIAYLLGFNNNNCLKTGCVQGGIGYWQLMKTLMPDVFLNMAAVEHELTDLAGKPVTMLKDQGKDGGLVFLLPHPKYPNIKDISMMKGRPPKPLVDCNGFCGINDGIEEAAAEEINFGQQVYIQNPLFDL